MVTEYKAVLWTYLLLYCIQNVVFGAVINNANYYSNYGRPANPMRLYDSSKIKEELSETDDPRAYIPPLNAETKTYYKEIPSEYKHYEKYSGKLKRRKTEQIDSRYIIPPVERKRPVYSSKVYFGEPKQHGIPRKFWSGRYKNKWDSIPVNAGYALNPDQTYRLQPDDKNPLDLKMKIDGFRLNVISSPHRRFESHPGKSNPTLNVGHIIEISRIGENENDSPTVISNKEDKFIPMSEPTPNSIDEFISNKDHIPKDVNQFIPGQENAVNVNQFIPSQESQSFITKDSVHSLSGDVSQFIPSQEHKADDVNQFIPSQEHIQSDVNKFIPSQVQHPDVNQFIPSQEPNPGDVNQLISTKEPDTGEANQFIPSQETNPGDVNQFSFSREPDAGEVNQFTPSQEPNPGDGNQFIPNQEHNPDDVNQFIPSQVDNQGDVNQLLPNQEHIPSNVDEFIQELEHSPNEKEFIRKTSHVLKDEDPIFETKDPNESKFNEELEREKLENEELSIVTLPVTSFDKHLEESIQNILLNLETENTDKESNEFNNNEHKPVEEKSEDLDTFNEGSGDGEEGSFQTNHQDNLPRKLNQLKELNPEVDDHIKTQLDNQDSRSSFVEMFFRNNDSSTACKTPSGEPGQCKSVTQCILSDALNNFGLFLQYLCIDRGVGVCCPDNPVIEDTDGDNSTAVTIQEFKQPIGGCGQNSNSRIVGGTMSSPHEWTWMVALMRRNRFFCGGVIINDWYVLTAAHCVIGIKVKELSIRLGEYNFLENNEHQKDIPVAEIKRHAQFVTLTFQHDIALLKLKQQVEYTKFVGSICLPDKADQDYAEVNATVVGWGTVSFGGAASPMLRQVKIPVWSNEECDKTYLLESITDSFMCAGSPETGEDACQGDSGGPLMAMNEQRRWEVIGIVSWGRRCGDPTYPGVYTRVTTYLDWIQDNIK